MSSVEELKIDWLQANAAPEARVFFPLCQRYCLSLGIRSEDARLRPPTPGTRLSDRGGHGGVSFAYLAILGPIVSPRGRGDPIDSRERKG